jgi:hypothetical protein
MHGIKLVAAVLLVFAAARGMTQEHQHVEKLGEVHFATSCNEVAQGEFNRAIALLHSFQFSRAIEGFNAVLGKAMAHVGADKPGRPELEEAREALAKQKN